MLSLLIATVAVAFVTLLFWLGNAGWGATKRAIVRFRQQPHDFRVVARIDHNEDLFSLRLESLERKCRPYLGGQYLTVIGPMLPAGNNAERRYSIDGWEAKPRHYGLTIKREAQGRVSGWLCDEVSVGSILRCRLPEGDFVLPKHSDAAPIVLVAAGVGITPLRAMIHALHAVHHKGSVTLFFTARKKSGLAFHDEFDALTRTWPNFKYTPHLTGLNTDWKGQIGRIAVPALLDSGGGNAHYLFCTSHEMIETLTSGLRLGGVGHNHIHYELFGGAAGVCGNFHLRVGETIIPVEGYPNLLAAMETHAVPVISDCRAGHCGLCRRTIVEGSVEHGPGLACRIGPRECLPCIAVPTADIILAS